MKKLGWTFLASILFALGGGCNPIDCHQICSRYKDCFDSKYDVAACVQRCVDNSTKRNDYAHQVDRCSACIDDRTCASATFSCIGDCSNVVP